MFGAMTLNVDPVVAVALASNHISSAQLPVHTNKALSHLLLFTEISAKFLTPTLFTAPEQWH